jgi:hypothetical protein
MMTGTDAINAALFTIAILFGLLAIQIAGGVRTVPGALNLILISKFLLFAVIVKTLTWQALDSQLRAPRTTAEVMALGFIGLFAGTWLCRVLPSPAGLVGEVTSSRTYLALTIVFFGTTMLSAFAVLAFANTYSTELTGGFWGLANSLMVLAPFSIVPAMYFAWSSGSGRFLSHPLVVGILSVQVVYGIMSTTKERVMEPLLCFFAIGFIRYGLRNKTLWALVAVGLMFYSLILYPYSQYVRQHGGRDGDLATRLETIKEVFFNISTDASFRDKVEAQIAYSSESYLGKDFLTPYSRMAMVGEADRLIAASQATESYTGWDTIVSGLTLMVPSFIMPDKPVTGGGNVLGRLAGDVAENDNITQISYGVMASLYNAFALKGALLGSLVFFAVFYYVIRFWYRDPILSFGPFGSTIWFILIALANQHSLIEAPVGNLLPGFINPLVVVALVYAAKFLASLLPASADGPQYGNQRVKYSAAGGYR